MHHAHHHYGASYFELLWHFLGCSLGRGTSFLDYFYLRFFALDDDQRDTYIGTGRLHDFHVALNDRRYIRFLRSKLLFYDCFRPMMRRECVNLKDLSDEQFAAWATEHTAFIAKPSLGVVGRGVRLVTVDVENVLSLRILLLKQGLDMAEELIIQHEDLKHLNPSSVNTVRLMTVYEEGRVDIIGAILRIGVGKVIDNFAAGGIAAPLDVNTGIVSGPGIYKDFWKEPCENHPLTHESVEGFCVPYWQQVLELGRQAAMVEPHVRTVGWDIAITSSGPVLVEGNDNWDEVIWELCMGHGGMSIVRRYARV